MDKILRVNMGTKGSPTTTVEPIGAYAGLGGRALTSAIISKEVLPACHPLSETNKIVIAPGLLSGSIAAMSGRISVGCKSPLTGGIKESNSGGQPRKSLRVWDTRQSSSRGNPKVMTSTRYSSTRMA